MKFEKVLEGVFDEGTEEYSIISEAYDLIVKSAPTVSGEAKTHLILLDHCRTNLATLYYMIGRNISKLRDTIQSAYDSSYTRLVKLGRPSKDAIESEIRLTCPEYLVSYKKIRDLEEVQSLVNMYLRCVDSNKTTTLELLRNIQRID